MKQLYSLFYKNASGQCEIWLVRAENMQIASRTPSNDSYRLHGITAINEELLAKGEAIRLLEHTALKNK